ncbi:hypothetical protein GCM10010517_34240 [Streptosporangium fragile]|uniref:Serine protease n=1 Tax=Streptosporangium fragile TaxID=46186 RepID=A0ABN3VYA7_9ACTN
MVNSYSRLSTIASETLTLDASQVPGIGGVVETRPWPGRNQVLLTANAVTPEPRLALAQRYGTNTVTIRLNPDAAHGQAHGTRDADNDGHINGGSSFNTSKSRVCTTGFAWAHTDGRRMVTAGHCFPDLADGEFQYVVRDGRNIGVAVAGNWVTGTGSAKLPGRTKTRGNIALIACSDTAVKPTASIFVGGSNRLKSAL